jgi:hypothetical protein
MERTAAASSDADGRVAATTDGLSNPVNVSTAIIRGEFTTFASVVWDDEAELRMAVADYIRKIQQHSISELIG